MEVQKKVPIAKIRTTPPQMINGRPLTVLSTIGTQSYSAHWFILNCIMNYNPTVKYKNDKNCTLSLEWEFRKIIFYKMPLITAHKKKS